MCKCLTLKDKKCKRSPQKDSEFCWQHQNCNSKKSIKEIYVKISGIEKRKDKEYTTIRKIMDLKRYKKVANFIKNTPNEWVEIDASAGAVGKIYEFPIKDMKIQILKKKQEEDYQGGLDLFEEVESLIWSIEEKKKTDEKIKLKVKTKK